MSDTPVLIVGAGPTGLALALFLANQGAKPRIIEKNSGPGQASRAMAVHARTLEFYNQLGFAGEVVEKGIPVRTMRLRDGGHEVARIDVSDIGKGLSPYPFILSFPQDDHESLLVEHLKDAGIEVEWNTELTGFAQDEDAVHAALRKGDATETCDASYLCGCDGAHSTVRKVLDLSFPGGSYSHIFYVADVEATGDVAGNDDFNFCLNPEGFNLLFPIRSSGMNRLIGIVPDALDAPDSITFEDIRANVERETGIAVKTVNWFSTYHVHHRVAEHFRVGRAFVLGDAGHVHSPAGGQGMNTGIGDAVNLAWKLAAVLEDRAVPSVLDTYDPERIAFAHSLVESTDRIFQFMVRGGLTGSIVRGMLAPHILPLAFGFSGVRKGAFKLASQIRINYHDSAISVGSAGAIRAGDRLPWIENSDNFESLQLLDWQVHVYGNAEDSLLHASKDAGLSLHEFSWSDEMSDAGLERNALYLIRPDGHVAFAEKNQDISGLHDYLSKFKIVPRSKKADPQASVHA